MSDLTFDLPPDFLLALFLVSSARAAEVALPTLQELLAAGLIGKVGKGWALSAAGANRMRKVGPRKREELAAIADSQLPR
jgi:hypothetical protein